MGQSKSSGRGHGPGLSTSLKSLINFWAAVPLDGLCGTKLPFPDSMQTSLRTGHLEEAPDCAGQARLTLGQAAGQGGQPFPSGSGNISAMKYLRYHRKCNEHRKLTAAPTKLQLKRQGRSPEMATKGNSTDQAQVKLNWKWSLPH